jgi:hypothetical protein
MPLVTISALLLAPALAPAAQPAPSAWTTVVTDEARGAVEISATAKDGTTRFVGSCQKGAAEPGISGVFSGYQGTGLRTDGQIEHVAFYARGEGWQDAFSVQLRYAAAMHAWVFAKPLSPVFLSSFSRGGTLAVVNSRNQEVLIFDLTGSTAATHVMRTVCGLPTD